MQPVGRSVDDDGFLLVGEEGGPISATGAKAGRPIALDARKFCFQRFYRWAREIGRGSMTPKVRYWVATEEIGLISDDTVLPLFLEIGGSPYLFRRPRRFGPVEIVKIGEELLCGNYIEIGGAGKESRKG